MIPFEHYTPTQLRHLTGGKTVSPILPYTILSEDLRAFNENRGRLSLSGAQSKFSMVVRDGKFVLTREGEQGTHILKPKLSNFEHAEASPANEHLMMQIASRVFGIETAENNLCFFANGEPAYITRRYDIRADGSRIQQEDFASLGGISAENYGKDFKYNALSYEDIGHLIRKFLPAAAVELIHFFDLILFNFLFSNGDAHLKNFSVLMTPQGDYRLSPAYDLINTRLHLPDDGIFALRKGLFADGRQIPLGLRGVHFLEFAGRIGIPERIASRELARFCADYPEVEKMVAESFLPEPLQEIYLTSYKIRLNSFLRT